MALSRNFLETNYDFRIFLEEIQNSEIVGLQETHIHDDILNQLEIPGFKRIAYKNETLKSPAKKGDGGIAIFIKEHLSKGIIPQKTSREYSIWVKIKKETIQSKDDIFLAFVYMNPHKTIDDDAYKIQVLQDQVLRFQKNGRVIFAGDLNARTKNEIDYILPDINGVQDFSKILPALH